MSITERGPVVDSQTEDLDGPTILTHPEFSDTVVVSCLEEGEELDLGPAEGC